MADYKNKLGHVYKYRARCDIGLFLYVHAILIIYRGKYQIYTPNLYPLID